MLKQFWVWAICLFLFGSGCILVDEFGLTEMRRSIVYSSSGYVSSPSVVRLGSGEHLIVFREADDQRAGNGLLLLSHSYNEGKTWSVPDTLVKSRWDCRDPSIVQLKDGIVIVNFYQVNNGELDSFSRSIGCFTVHSFDNGKTFTAPRMVRSPDWDWTATSDDILELENGRLLMPVYGAHQGKASLGIVFSTNGGETWEGPSNIAEDAENRVTYIDPSVMESAGLYGRAADLHVTVDGILLCAFRDRSPAGISMVRSYDGGISWENETMLASGGLTGSAPSLITSTHHLFAVHDGTPRQGAGSKNLTTLYGTAFRVDRLHEPQGFSVSEGKSEVDLRWNSVPATAYYMVYRDTVPDFELIHGYPDTGNGIATPIEPFYTDTRVDSGKIYYYRVTAVAGKGALLQGWGNQSRPSVSLEISVH